MTRALVGQLNDDGSITEIYCDSGGDPERMAAILEESYVGSEQLTELLKLGDVNRVEKRLEDCWPLSSGSSHMPCETHSTLEDLLMEAHSSDCEWVYINMFGFWTVMNTEERSAQLLEDLYVELS